MVQGTWSKRMLCRGRLRKLTTGWAGWGQKRGKPWGPDEEAILWQLRHQGMEFEAIAGQIDRTERGCYDRFNKLRNEGYGRSINI